MEENKKQIAEIDEKLKTLSEAWKDAREEKKDHWMNQINTLLEKRLALKNPVMEFSEKA